MLIRIITQALNFFTSGREKICIYPIVDNSRTFVLFFFKKFFHTIFTELTLIDGEIGKKVANNPRFGIVERVSPDYDRPIPDAIEALDNWFFLVFCLPQIFEWSLDNEEEDVVVFAILKKYLVAASFHT